MTDYEAAKAQLARELRGEAGGHPVTAARAIARVLAGFRPEAGTDVDALRGVCLDILEGRHGEGPKRESLPWRATAWVAFDLVRALVHDRPDPPADRPRKTGRGVRHVSVRVARRAS